MFRLGLLIATHGRRRLTGLVLARWRRMFDALLDQGVALCPMVVRDRGDEQDVPAYFCQTLYPNLPVSNKHNAGLRAMRGDGLDAVMVSGSDDLVPEAWITHAVKEITRGVDHVRHVGLYVFDAERGRMLDFPVVNTGVGRVFSRRLLDAVGWELWVPGRNRILDGSIDIVLGSHALAHHYADRTLFTGEMKAPLVDIKTSEGGVTPLSYLIENALHAEADASMLRDYFPDVAGELLNWNPAVLAADIGGAASTIAA